MRRSWLRILCISAWAGLASVVGAQEGPSRGPGGVAEPVPVLQAVPPPGGAVPGGFAPGGAPPGFSAPGLFPPGGQPGLMPGGEPLPVQQMPYLPPRLPQGYNGPYPDASVPTPPELPNGPNAFIGMNEPANAFAGERLYDHSMCIVGIEYLYWLTPNAKIPALITRGSFEDAVPGALGQPNTRVLLGNEIGRSGYSGVRTTLTSWFYDDMGVEANFFFLADRDNEFAYSGTGATTSPVLARPYLNAAFNREDADPVAFPDLLDGGIQVKYASQLLGAEFNVLNRIDSSAFVWNVDYLLGFRFLLLNEHLDIQSIAQDRGPAPLTRTAVVDQFGARNQFYGGQIGTKFSFYGLDPFFWSTKLKLGLGQTVHNLRNNGYTRITNELNQVVAQSETQGLLVQRSNRGTHQSSSFSVVPEIGTDLGFVFFDRFRLTGGYSVLMWTNVARAGEQINRSANVQALNDPGQIGVRQPSAFQNTSFYWTHGVNVAFEIFF